MNWLRDLALGFKIKEIRDRLLFVLLILGIFRLLAVIPVPGVDSDELARFFEGDQFFGLLNIFSGGALSNLSIVMLGLGPYITSTIILQLLTLVFPKLKELHQESGDEGRRKFTQYGRLLTIPFAAIQGFGLIVLFRNQGVLSIEGPLTMVAVIVSIVAGSILLMWLGELVSEKGIGNGISLLIFAGIISAAPQAIGSALTGGTFQQDLPQYLLFAGISLFIIMSVVMVNEARRNIPITHARRIRGSRAAGGSASSFLPLTLNPAGVIPIIFAVSLVLFPGLIGQFLESSSNETLKSISTTLVGFTENTPLYSSIYFLLVVLFTYFYTSVTFNPSNVAKNLQRQGGFIPGNRPGEPTAQRIRYILNRTLLVGALFLGIIAVVPAIAQGGLEGGGATTTTSFIIGGTSVLILVSVVLETMRQIKAQVEMRQYDR